MSISVRITSDTVDRTVRRVVVGVTVQLVSERQTVQQQKVIRNTEQLPKNSLCIIHCTLWWTLKIKGCI